MMYGGGIGVVSSLAGIGGGSLSVPFLNHHGVEMRKAVGSSSVCGCVIAISGMLGFIWHGSSVNDLPAFSWVTFIYQLWLRYLAPQCYFSISAKLATQLPTPVLKKFFCGILMFIASMMLL